MYEIVETTAEGPKVHRFGDLASAEAAFALLPDDHVVELRRIELIRERWPEMPAPEDGSAL